MTGHPLPEDIEAARKEAYRIVHRLMDDVERLKAERDKALKTIGIKWQGSLYPSHTDAEWIAIGRRAAGLPEEEKP